MSQNCFLFRTSSSSSAKKECAPPKAALRIRLENQAKQSGRRFAPPTPPLVQNRLVPFWCLYCTKLAPIFKINSRYIPQGKALTREYARALAKRERGNVRPDERLKWEERSLSRKNGLGFAKQFCGREDSQNRD